MLYRFYHYMRYNRPTSSTIYVYTYVYEEEFTVSSFIINLAFFFMQSLLQNIYYSQLITLRVIFSAVNIFASHLSLLFNHKITGQTHRHHLLFKVKFYALKQTDNTNFSKMSTYKEPFYLAHRNNSRVTTKIKRSRTGE